MREYLRLPEKILLIVYYIFHLIFQTFKVRRFAMPSYMRPSVQKPEHSQAFDVNFLFQQLKYHFLMTVRDSEALGLP